MLRLRSLIALAMLVLLGWHAAARAGVPNFRPTDTRPIRMDFDRELAGRLQEATRLMQRQSWPEALRILQTLLDSSSDALFMCTLERPETLPTVWRSGRLEATRLLAQLPAKELAEYQRQAEPAAKELLRGALEKDDRQMYARVYFRYPHTNASAEAAALLANHDRDYLAAAILFRKLLSRPEWADKLSDLSLYHATLAFCFSGDAEGASLAWKRLAAKRGEKPVRVEGRLLRLDELKNEVEKAQAVRASGPPEWSMYRGTPARRPAGNGGPFALNAAWSLSTVMAPESGAGDARAWTEDLIKSCRQQLEARQAPILPALHPLMVKGQAIYRTYNGVYAAYLTEQTIEIVVGGETLVEKKKPGDHFWWSHTDGGVLTLVRDPNKKGVIDSWRGQYKRFGGAHSLFENSITGTISSDGARVFVIDDLVLLPHPQAVTRFRLGWGGQMNFGALQKQVAERNTLKAYSIDQAGALRWELGGDHDPNPATKDSFFLGPPLPIDKSLYVLNEKDGALRLLRLETRDGPERSPPPPQPIWTVKLADVRTRVAFDFPRRIHAAHVAYADGMFVCPTNAGAIFGVDPLARRVAWAYRYQTVAEPEAEDDKSLDPLTEHWKVTAPAIVGDAVLFAAPDGAALECLELATGQPRWQARRSAGDLYIAGAFDGLALVVNRDHCRALKVADGSLAWKLDKTGVPSGQGVAAAGVYYLPLAAGADSKQPEVLAIDIAKGTVVRRLTKQKKDGKIDVPGNLVFANGQVISQTVDSISAYPLLQK